MSRIRQLPPLILREWQFMPLERYIAHLFYTAIYSDIYAVFKRNGFEVQNKKDPLADALRKGRIRYSGGKFYGDFSSKTSKRLKEIGATYNARSQTWTLRTGSLPPEISLVIAGVQSRMQTVQHQIIATLDSVDIDRLIDEPTIARKYKRVIESYDSEFTKAVKSISIVPKLTQQMKDTLAREWGENLSLYIRKWTGGNILKLREQVRTHALDGGRAESLEDLIQHNYATSKAKARFLARQETSLLMSKFREERYKEAGIVEYRWSTSKDEKVRHSHAKLDGKIFRFDDPPVVDEHGTTANPGEDFGCRCVAVPVIREEDDDAND